MSVFPDMFQINLSRKQQKWMVFGKLAQAIQNRLKATFTQYQIHKLCQTQPQVVNKMQSEVQKNKPC